MTAAQPPPVCEDRHRPRARPRARCAASNCLRRSCATPATPASPTDQPQISRRERARVLRHGSESCEPVSEESGKRSQRCRRTSAALLRLSGHPGKPNRPPADFTACNVHVFTSRASRSPSRAKCARSAARALLPRSYASHAPHAPRPSALVHAPLTRFLRVPSECEHAPQNTKFRKYSRVGKS